MSANNKGQNVANAPLLRFPEFKDEWNIVKVSDLLEFYSTNSYSWDQLDFEVGEIFNLHYGMIHNGLPTMMNAKENILPFVKEKPKNYTICKEGDVAFADASEDTNDVAKCIEFTNCDRKQIICGLHTIHGRDKLGITKLGYKGYAFSSKAFHDQVKKLAQGTKIYSISAKTFSECFVGIPSNKEQQKIAKLLSLIDKRIETQRSAIEKLKSLKSAIVESLWDQKANAKIGDLIEQVSIRNKDNEKLPILSVSNKFGFINQEDQFEDRVIASENTSGYKIVSKNIFAYNPARINVGSIALMKEDIKGIISPMYICFKVKNNVTPEYLEQFLFTKDFYNEMSIRLEGSVRQCLSFDALCDIPLHIPNKEQQQYYSKKVESLVQKINLEQNMLDALIKQKSYFLNKMFI